MPSLAELIQLPAEKRAELAMALWASLSPEQRDASFSLSEDEGSELDRRWAEHVANPDSAISSGDVLKRLSSRK
jgi:putative addiction module component (TIGR02574 family)